jgi:HD-like signal output (HDOD) protein
MSLNEVAQLLLNLLWVFFMNEMRFRIIFEGLDKGAQLRKLVVYLQKERGLSEDIIRNLLTDPPRVLWEVDSDKEADSIRETLEKMGCRSYSEPIMGTADYPFAISKKDHKTMNQELSKILRVRANLALFLVQVLARTPGTILPSMMGPFREKIEFQFRESDTVIGVDDTRIIILGFSTDKQGVYHLEKKTHRVFGEILGKDILVSTGYSLFPQEGRNLSKLIQLAESKRKSGTIEETPEMGPSKPDESETEQTATAVIEVEEGESEGKRESLQQCFSEARGKIFQRLMNLDPEILWRGLSCLPEIEQKEFLGRLPFDSPLCPILEQKIDSHGDATDEAVEGHHFEAIFHQMALAEGLDERKAMQESISSKLNRVEALPTLPSIASHIFKIASNPSSSAEDLTKVIMNDPPLTSKLLKIVNSAFYGFPQKIGTVKQVVVILGTEEIMDLSFGLAAARVFRFKPVNGLCDPKALWHHSLSTALIAQHLCQKFPEYQKLGAFTAGLLHDFGKIFLMENFAAPYGQLHLDAAQQDIPLIELEEERLGLNHAFIGDFLAANWNLPDALVKAIAFHHRPFSAPEHSELAALIGLADYLHCRSTSVQTTGKKAPLLVPPLTYGHWSILTGLFKGLDDAMLEKMTDEAMAILEDNQELFAMLE